MMLDIAGITPKSSQSNNMANGLGYHIIKDLLRLLQGKISINSKLGAGTEVSIDIPLNK